MHFHEAKELVVYRTIPTSNHNRLERGDISIELYIVLFLHQTTTPRQKRKKAACCISYYSYIKPQPMVDNIFINNVVYRTIPTSNHNFYCSIWSPDDVVYRTIPTSNHNLPSVTHNM